MTIHKYRPQVGGAFDPPNIGPIEDLYYPAGSNQHALVSELLVYEFHTIFYARVQQPFDEVVGETPAHYHIVLS